MTANDHEYEDHHRERISEHRESSRAGGRQRYDLFHAGESSALLAVFIHGGYRRLGSRQDMGSRPAPPR